MNARVLPALVVVASAVSLLACRPPLVAATLKAISKRPAAFPRVLATSSEKGAGMPELRAEILAATMV